MSGIMGNRTFVVLAVCGVGVYTGVKFFEPLVINQLKKDGHIRQDIDVPEYDEDGNSVVNGVNTGSVWEDFRQRLAAAVDEKDQHPLTAKSAKALADAQTAGQKAAAQSAVAASSSATPAAATAAATAADAAEKKN